MSSAATVSASSSHVKTRFLIISDTHSSDPATNNLHNAAYRSPLPKADVLLHCGDLTMIGHLNEYEKIMSVLESIDSELKLVIAGNHDISLDENYYQRTGRRMHGRKWDENMPREAREMWTGERARQAGVTYLEEGTYSFTLKNGGLLRVYASPYQPEFCDFAFPYSRNEDRFNPPHNCTPQAVPIAENPVPDWPEIDVMMTHGPPMGILDAVRGARHVGCQHLLRAGRRCKPRMHCFGHIHEGWGAQKVQWTEGDGLDVKPEQQIKSAAPISVNRQRLMDERAAYVDISTYGENAVEFGRETLMVNASIMSVRYDPSQGPWLVDMDLQKVHVD